MSTQKTFSFWWIWLVCVTGIVMVFGLSMVLLPDILRQFFSLVLFGEPLHLASFEEPAVSYLTLVHGVLGAAMFGWGAALLAILLDSFKQVRLAGWWGLVLSIAAWYLPDSLFSLWTGYWLNAVLNTVFAVLFLIPLAATYRAFRQ